MVSTRWFKFWNRDNDKKEIIHNNEIKKLRLEKHNIKYLILGSFFVVLSGIFVEFFLPLFLKNEGLNILQIGSLLTIGLALGTLFLTIIFSSIQRKIKLKKGLDYSSLFAFFTSFILFVTVSNIGIIFSAIGQKLKDITFTVSRDVTLHNNTRGGTRRLASSQFLIIISLAFIIGLALSVLLVLNFGFIITFLIFSLLSFPAYFYFNRIKEDTRFKPRLDYKLPKVGKKLKLFLFAGILYQFALSASFVLVITFLVTDLLVNPIFISFLGSTIILGELEWLAIIFIGLYVSMTVSTMVTRKHLSKFNLIATTILGMSILMVSALVVIVSQNVYFLLGAMILEGIGAGIWVPSHEAYYWKETKPSLREKVAGYYWGWSGFFKAIGPLAGGFIVVVFGILSPFLVKAIT